MDMSKIEYLEITYVNLLKDRMEIGWTSNIGFGVLTINITEDGFEIETECLGEEFCERVLDQFKQHIMSYGKIVE